MTPTFVLASPFQVFFSSFLTHFSTEYYDSNTGKLLFTAPVGRSFKDFLVESRAHGWPSFRDEEVNWEFVRVLNDGMC